MVQRKMINVFWIPNTSKSNTMFFLLIAMLNFKDFSRKLSISMVCFLGGGPAWFNIARSMYQEDDPRVLLETSDTLVLQKPAGVEDGKQIWRMEWCGATGTSLPANQQVNYVCPCHWKSTQQKYPNGWLLCLMFILFFWPRFSELKSLKRPMDQRDWSRFRGWQVDDGSTSMAENVRSLSSFAPGNAWKWVGKGCKMVQGISSMLMDFSGNVFKRLWI